MANELNPSLGLLDTVLSKAMQTNQGELGIIDFIEQLLDLGSLADGSKIRPWVTQKAMLKAYYGLPMEPAEQAYIDTWVSAGKCTWKAGKVYRELVLESGMRSSKTALCSWIILYEFYKLLLLDSPQTTYGFPKSQPIFIIALATTEAQSKDTVFGYVKSYMEGSPYFMGMVASGELQIDSLRIRHHTKNITIICGHSNSSGLVGRTSKIACFDELARFENKDGSARNGMDVKSNIGRSTTSFREHGRIVSISSAWEEGDAMEMLYAAAEDDSTGMLGFRLNSFDMNPTLKRDDPYIVAQYKQNEVAARRDFEGIRPGGQESFFNRAIIEEASTGKLCVKFDWFTRTVNDRVYSAVHLGRVEQLKWPHHSYAHSDPGLKHDSYAFATGHGERTQRGIIAVIDTLIEWRPQHSKDPKDRGKNVIWPTDLDNVEDVVLDICKARNVRRLGFDHWNSASMIQRLYAQGIPTDEYHFSQTFQQEIYATFRERLANQLVILPDPGESESAAKLQRELIELQLVNGKKIDHKPSGCFTGDTKVSLLDGREVSFLDLIQEFGEGQPFYVYACDPVTHEVKVGEAYSPRLTKKDAEIVAVTLDNGEVIRCTPDHRFMLRDGAWCEAKDLHAGSSLMPLYRKVSTKPKDLVGYELYMNPATQTYQYTHRMVGKFKYGEAYTNGRKEGLILHHERGKRNNDPGALFLMGKVEHGLAHAEDIKRKRLDPAFEKKREENFLRYARGTGREISRENMKRLWADDAYRAVMREVHAKVGKVTGPANLTRYNQSEDHRRKASETGKVNIWKAIDAVRRKDVTVEKILAAAETSSSMSEICRKLSCTDRVVKRVLSGAGIDWKPYLSPQASRWNGRASTSKGAAIINHKVVSVEPAGHEDVYDLSVRGLENFALTAGVFVHNSKDLADVVAMVIYKIAEEERRYGRRTNGAEGLKFGVFGKNRIPKIQW